MLKYDLRYINKVKLLGLLFWEGGENVKDTHCKVFWLSVSALFNDLSGFLLLVIIIIVSFASFLGVVFIFVFVLFVEIVKCLLVGVA